MCSVRKLAPVRALSVCALLIVLLFTPWPATEPFAGAATIGVNFAGPTLSDEEAVSRGLAPPDTDGAIGPSHYAEFLNGVFAVYTRSGTLATPMISDTTFWSNAGISSSVLSPGLSDTRILYDPPSGRWFASEVNVSSTKNQVLLARSDSSDPTAGWKAVNFTGSSLFADYPTLGVDANGVYVGTNNFYPTGFFHDVTINSIPKADLLLATPSLARLQQFEDPTNSLGFTLQGVVSRDPGPADGHGVIMAVNTFNDAQINRTTVNSPSGTATLSPTIVKTVSAAPFPPEAAQPDGTRQIDTLDNRFTGSIVEVAQAGNPSKNRIYMANAIDVAGNAAIRWTVLDEATSAVLKQGTISDPNYDYFQPSIAANQYGDVVIGCNRSGTGASSFISAFALVGTTNFTTEDITFGDPLLLKSGTSNYHLFGGSGERWGDFSATMVDPNDPRAFWTTQEFPLNTGTVNNPNYLWATQITQITVPEPGSLALLGSAAICLVGYRWRRRRV